MSNSLNKSASDYLSPEMLEKIKLLLGHTPIDLVLPIKDYWGATSIQCSKAMGLITQPNQQTHQSDN